MKIIKLYLDQHQGGERLFASFPYDTTITAIMQAMPGSRWSRTKQCWHMPLRQGDKQTVELLKERLLSKAELDCSKLTSMEPQLPELSPLVSSSSLELPAVFSNPTLIKAPLSSMHLKALDAYVSLLRLTNYSENTIKNYRSWFIVFLQHFPLRKPSTLTKAEIMDFLIHYRTTEKWSS